MTTSAHTLHNSSFTTALPPGDINNVYVVQMTTHKGSSDLVIVHLDTGQPRFKTF